MNGECLRLYAWNDAPEKYRALSTNRGNEDWVLVGPKNHPAWSILFWDAFALRETPRFGWAEVFHARGETVAIFSRA